MSLLLLLQYHFLAHQFVVSDCHIQESKAEEEVACENAKIFKFPRHLHSLQESKEGEKLLQQSFIQIPNLAEGRNPF